jgi:prepilin-type N-terminal cleavage/methylation domain-containing protein
MAGTKAVGRAFTLIELLVVIAIIALLVSLILPSLGSAKRTTWNVLCQNNLRQIGLATQLYFDDQKDPVFFDMGSLGSGIYYHVPVVDTLQPYMSYAGNVPFDCPGAKGLSSVRDPANMAYLLGAGRIFVNFDVVFDNTRPVTKYTEYWFNDSRIAPDPPAIARSGVSKRPWRLIKWPQYLVMATDALDEFPRHQGAKANVRTTANQNTGAGRVGKNNFLFGDQAVRMLEYAEYQERPDPAGAPAPFFNWGHVY